MSKSALKKELAGFTREQLIEVILNTYDSSAEAKEYFEFFLNPDVDALMEKQLTLLKKELLRSKWGQCKARVSVLNGTIKKFVSFGVPKESVWLYILNILVLMGLYSYHSYFTDTQLRAFARYLTDYLTLSDECNRMETALKNITKIKDHCDPAVCSLIDRVVADYNSNQKIK